MKKIRVASILLLTIFVVTKARSVGVADIPTISSVATLLSQDANDLSVFAQEMQSYNQTNFVFTVTNTTQTVSLTALQKQALIAKYMDLKARMQTDFQLLP